jgi:hypothetical protein
VNESRPPVRSEFPIIAPFRPDEWPW